MVGRPDASDAMLNIDLLKSRLGWYGAAWLGTFVAVLIAALVAVLGFKVQLVDAVDVLLVVALGGLTLAAVGVLGFTLVSRESLPTKAAVLVLGLLLGLPLLWSPVLAAVTAAWFTGAVIEYSGVYAGFRIAVSQVLYPLGQALGLAIEPVWAAFKVVASIVGFAASSLQVWNFLQRFRGDPEPAPVELTEEF